MKNKGKVLVGMSGGVDSSVAAALLIEQGYEVAGVTMTLTNTDDLKETQAVKDAKHVAQQLGIKHYTVNFNELFEHTVIKYFKEEYMIARTPNPCIRCNKKIKFGAMLDKAIELGYDFLSTGHYAVVEKGNDDIYYLKKSPNNKKDQSYFLYTLKQPVLSKVLFPLGCYTKDKIRQKAEELELNIANKPDSQEICFIPNDDYKAYLQKDKELEFKKGDFIDSKGNVLGTHKGIINYTIGQRKGLGLSLGKPAYVTQINPKENQVVIGENSDLFKNILNASDLSLVYMDELPKKIALTAKIRYASEPAECEVINLGNKSVSVVFKEPQRAITPGQSVVFYDDDKVVGGAVIEG